MCNRKKNRVILLIIIFGIRSSQMSSILMNISDEIVMCFNSAVKDDSIIKEHF